MHAQLSRGLELSLESDYKIDGARVLLAFSPEEIRRRKHIGPGPATLIRSYSASKESYSFHVFQLDRPIQIKIGADQRESLQTDWIIARARTGSLEDLVAGQEPDRNRIDVVLFVSRNSREPSSSVRDPSNELIEICAGIATGLKESREPSSLAASPIRARPDRLTVAVGNEEWDSFYTWPGPERGPHKVNIGTLMQLQLGASPGTIIAHWNQQSPKKDLVYLALDSNGRTIRKGLIQVMPDSNLYFFSGVVRRIHRRVWKSDEKKETIETLLDCSVPLVVSEIVAQGERSGYVQNEGDFLIGLCWLFGSVAFSGSHFRAPMTVKVEEITALHLVPSQTLIECELQSLDKKPTITIAYHATPLEDIDLSTF
jgi:hypothetical protein